MADYTVTTPEDELKQLDQEIAEDKAKVQELSREIETNSRRRTEVSKTVEEIKAKTTAWNKALEAASQQEKDFDGYIKTKKQMLEAAVPNKDEVIQAKKDALKKLADLEKELSDRQEDLKKAQAAYVASQAATVVKREAYNAIAGQADTNDKVLKDLSALRTAADKEGAGNQNARMYFLVLVMEDVIARLDLRSAQEYIEAVNKAGAEYSDAQKDEQEAKTAVDEALAAVQKAEKDLDTARANWRQEVLSALTAPKAAGAPV